MAKTEGSLHSSATFSASTTRTLCQLVAPTNQAVHVKRVRGGFDAVSSSGAPARIRVLKQSGAGTSSSKAPVKRNNIGPSTLQTTGLDTFSSTEPTASDVLAQFQTATFHGGTFDIPLDVVLQGGERLGLEVLLPASVTSAVFQGGFDFEE